MAVKPIPEGYHTVTPLLSVKGAARLIDFMKKAFGATEVYRFPAPDGSVMHAELKIGNSVIMLGEPMDGSFTRPATFYVYVLDADATYRAAWTPVANRLKYRPSGSGVTGWLRSKTLPGIIG